MSNLELRKILVVEDEVELCNLLVELLSTLGVDVQFTNDGESAFQKIRNGKFDLIVSDITMPKLSGIELFRLCLNEGIKIPFLFVTAHGEKEFLLDAIRLGASDYVEKPFDNEQLLETVSRLLEVGVRERRVKEAIAAIEPEILAPIMKEQKMADRFRLLNIFKKKQE
jgi:two-component system nitrogen regulation response regulator NtrX